MKKLLKFMLALVVVGGMSACSNNEKPQGGEDTPKTVEFSIWHTFTEGQETLLNELADEFEAANEGVTIEVIGGYDYTSFESTVSDAVTNGVGPNLVFNYATFAKNFDGYDMLLSFDDYWDFDYSTLTSAGIVQEATEFSDGKVHAVPVQTTGPVFFYNKTMYDQLGLDAPVTWADVKEDAKKIYEELGVVGFAVDSTIDLAQVLILQSHDGDYIDVENKKVLWNDEVTLEWVKWWAEGVQEGYFQLAPTTGNYNSSDINAGAIAAYIGSSAGIPYLDLSGIGGEIAVTRMPVIDENSKEVVAWNRSAIGFKTDDEATNQAIADFVAYFIEQDGRWVKALNAYSPYYAVQENEEYQAFVANDLALVALGQQINDGLVPPTVVGSMQVRTELQTLMAGCADPAFDAATALQNAATASEAALNE